MKKISNISGLVMPLNRRDVNTDLIIPAQYLTQVTQTGYGSALFRRLRDQDPEFVLNQPKFHSATILLTGENFGCGSSREHAVWALLEVGFKAIIASSFADIFYSNSVKNGLLLIKLSEDTIQKLFNKAKFGNCFLTIDIEPQHITTSDGELIHFEIEPFRKHCFLQGQDELDYILVHKKAIEAYDKKQREKNYSTVFTARLTNNEFPR